MTRVGSSRFGVLVLGVLLALTACSIQANADPRDIPEEQRSPLEAASGDAGPATGTGRVFLLRGAADADDVRLVSVQRPASAPEPVIAALLDGPNQAEVNAGLTTALPPELELRSVRQGAGTLFVDLSEEMLELASGDLRLAVAQIVYTAGELAAVNSVRLLVDGASREWPNGRGELQSDPLTVYDFPLLAESVQPAFPPVPAS